MGQPFDPQPGYQQQGWGRNPTDIVGERLGAALIDAIILFIVFVAVVSIFGETESTRSGNSFSYNSNDDGPATPLIMLGWIVGTEVIWQGLKGKTPGKAILGLTTVSSATGQPPGIGAAALRTLLKIIDWLPCVAMVGIGLIATRPDHRRVGDMAASTSVVKDADAGTPVPDFAARPQASWPTPAPGSQPLPQYGAPVPGVPPVAPPVVPPEPGEMVVPADGGLGPNVVADPTDLTSLPVDLGAPAEPPAADPPQELAPGEISTTEPQWDKDRNTYVQWDPVLAAWMQWESTTERWIPIS